MKKQIFLFALLFAVVFVAGCTSTGEVAKTADNNNAVVQAGDEGAKVFHMDSFYVIEDGKPHPQFSVKELSVNKGDKVVVYVNSTKGTHDFNIDELNVHSATPTSQVTRIEFTAPDAGDFVYYCNMPGHRANGHWGTLHVVG